MRFDELERRMRAFESAQDLRSLPGVHVVARLDGRSFTRLTKATLPLRRPFDPLFRDAMLATCEHLLGVGLRVAYAYTESDEISLLLAAADDAFGRKLRKLNSVLAGEASARFSLCLGVPAAFDCRVIQLPTVALVVDYFRWRQEDAVRNALNAYCYWKQREAGRDAREASRRLEGSTLESKRRLLLEHGVDFDRTPAWERLGMGLYREVYGRAGTDPRTGAPTLARRQRVVRELELPRGDAYADFVRARLQ